MDLLALLGAVSVPTLLLSWPLIRALRRKSYQRWPRPLRWAFLGVAGFLTIMGGILWTAHMIETWGLQAGLWFLLAPFLYGLSQATDRP